MVTCKTDFQRGNEKEDTKVIAIKYKYLNYNIFHLERIGSMRLNSLLYQESKSP